MALTSASTIEEIVAAYVDNSLFDVNNSTTQAAAFIQAGRILLMKRPKSINADGVTTAFDVDAIKSDLERATRFYNAKTGAGRVRIGDISRIGRR